MIANIQRLIAEETKLSIPSGGVAPRADLFALGLTAFDAIRLLLAVEREFQIEFPRQALSRRTASSIEAIIEALREVGYAPMAAEDVRKAA